MAKEANYVLKITLTEAATIRDALQGHEVALMKAADRRIARREPVSQETADAIDATRRLLARI